MRVSKIVLLVAPVVVAAGLVLARLFHPMAPVLTPHTAPIVLDDWKADDFAAPATISDAQMEALNIAIVQGSSLPSGFTKLQSVGAVKVTLTGAILDSGEVQFVVTLIDESADLETAQLYVGTTLLGTATPANGGIIDRSGLAAATLTGWQLPSAFTTGRIQWFNAASISVGEREFQWCC